MKRSTGSADASHPVTGAPATAEYVWRALRGTFAGGLCIAAAYVVTTTVHTTFRTTSPIVYWDAWQWIALLKSWVEGGFTWSSLFAVQNEHQIALERILLLADYYFSRGTNWPLILLNVVLYAGALLAFLKLFASAATAGRADRIDLAAHSAFVSVVMFAAANLANLSWSFVVSYVLAMTLIVFAVATAIQTTSAAQRGESRKAWAWLAATMTIALIGSYSGANGILIWPAVCAIFVFSGLRKNYIAVFVLIGAVVTALYVREFKLNSFANADPRVTWHNPATYLEYLPYVLGNAIVDAQNFTRKSLVLGWIGLLGSAIAGLAFLRTRKSWNSYQLGLLGVLTFELVTALMIALTRQNWGGPFAMVVDRYRLCGALFWSAGIGLLLSVSWPRPGMREAARVAAAALMAWITIAVVANQGRTLERYFDRYEDWELAADALRMQIMDKLALKTIMVPDASMISPIDFLRQHRLSVFADGRFEQVGKPFSALYQVAANATCEGNVRNVAAIDGEIGAWRSAGQAWDPLEKRALKRFIFVDNNSNKIIGLGSTVPPRPIYIRSPDPSKTNGWQGYLRALSKSTVSLYGLRRDRTTACYVATLRLE